MRVGFVGLGKLGLPCALAIESKGHTIYGYDIDPTIVEILDKRELPYTEEGAQQLLSKHNIILKDLKGVVENSDIIFVPIQTPHDEKFEGKTRIPKERKDFNYEYLKDGITDIANIISNLNEEKIVIIISTVLPGTIEREIKPIIGGINNFKLCYNPFFIAMGTTIQDFLNPEFVLFGTDLDSTASKVKDFYRTIHNKPFYRTTIMDAELIKVTYNTFIGMKIGFANTVMEICHRTGCSVDNVIGGIKMANDRLISTKYLNGGMGDGGGCHPRDNIAMSWLGEQIGISFNFFEHLMDGREKQTEFLVNLMLEHDGPYYILGKTFKKETNITTGSPSILLKNILEEKGVDVIQYDPKVDYRKPDFERGTYIVTVEHDEFKEFEFPKGSVVIDVLRFLELSDDLTHIKVGN